jgi:hypothetical protein
MKPLPNGTFNEWKCADGHAFVPNTEAGREWIKEADRIWTLPDNAESAELWDDHSLELERIGGRWL